ncbi:MAG: adenine deaminase [Bacteroidales bacterium]|nr:adenine deaminase [Bacteroidales bacterium]MBN2750042.1 adenine deaminase [Bacteroidales bacterium]
MSAEFFSVRGVVVDLVHEKLIPGEVFVVNGKVDSIVEDSSVDGPFLLPGFVDSHVHVESSMLSPEAFARAAVKHGTIAVVADPHEIANVAAVAGIDYMVESAKRVPFHFFFGVPSCVPASPMDVCHAALNADIVDALIQRNDMFFLGEMMNFPGVVNGDPDVLSKIESALKQGKPVDGHAPGLVGQQMVDYFAAGISTDHECFEIGEARKKIAQGAKILIREGSAAKNFEALIPLVSENPDMVMFCTDDCHPDDLLLGHINKSVKRAVKEGYSVFDILRIACVNPVKHYNLPVGLLQQNDSADFIVVDNLANFTVSAVYIKGEKVYSEGSVLFSASKPKVPLYNFRTTWDFDLKVKREPKMVRVIGVIPGELITESLQFKPWGSGTFIEADTSTDIVKIVLLNRYSEEPPSVGFIKGLGIQHGAFGLSVAHDSHHVIVAGTNDSDIRACLQFIVENRGGICACSKGDLVGATLPLFGLMSNKFAEDIAAEYKAVNSAVHSMGSTLHAPFMTLSFMALSVIPSLKINHLGLFDVDTFSVTNIFVE